MCTVWRRCSPMTASASVIRASARRMALPTATRARSGWSGKALVRPPNPAALDSWATSQSRSARAWRARPGSSSSISVVQALQPVPVLGDRLVVQDAAAPPRPRRSSRSARPGRPPGRRPGSPGAGWRSARPGGPRRCCPPPGRCGCAGSPATCGRPAGSRPRPGPGRPPGAPGSPGTGRPAEAASAVAASNSRRAASASPGAPRSACAWASRCRDATSAGQCASARLCWTAAVRCSMARSSCRVVSAATPRACCADPKQVTPRLPIIGRCAYGRSSS